METFKAITELITVLVWPATVLTIVLLFRREIHKLLVAVKEVKYPGGSISMQEVNALAATVPQQDAPLVTEATTSIPFSDPLLVIAQVRIDVERELFRLSESALDSRMASSWVGDSRLAPDYIMDRRDTHVTNWHRSRHIDELQRTQVIAQDVAENLRKFFDISNRIMHGGDVSSDVVSGTAAIGADLLASIRVKRIAYEAQVAMNGQMMCSHGERTDEEQIRFCLISHVAAEADVLGYDYDTYSEAVRVFNLRHRRAPGNPREIITLTLADFLEGLRWREKELERYLSELSDRAEGKANNNWKWPPEWGDVGWSGPILRYIVGLGSDTTR